MRDAWKRAGGGPAIGLGRVVIVALPGLRLCVCPGYASASSTYRYSGCRWHCPEPRGGGYSNASPYIQSHV